MNLDYENFVARMGSFEMDVDEIDNPELTHKEVSKMTQFIKITEENNELMHYGIPGMHWGHRSGRTPTSQLQRSSLRKEFDRKKAAKKDANSEYGDAFNSYVNGGLGVTAAGRRANVRRSAEFDRTINKSIRADEAFKKVKNERKTQIKGTAKNLEAQTSFKERMLYNPQTRKRAAKYIVDNNMSVDEARKRANSDANRNTAIFVAAYGAMTLGVMAYNKTR